jgi:hypothetical protein
MAYNRKYYLEHRESILQQQLRNRESINAWQRKHRLEISREIVREYHHKPPKAKIVFCNDPLCGKKLDWTRYNEHYCSRECYLRAFDKYRVVIK